jgi:hypothetical protein
MPILRLPMLVALGLVAVLPSALWAVTPESPEVVAVIERGIAFLERSQLDTRMGAQCLAGLCMIKNGKPADHPIVVQAVKTCSSPMLMPNSDDNYSVGLAIIFLCELDAQQHHDQIQNLLNKLLERQQKGGGWGYQNAQVGDTSQVQYATLGLWTADAYGFDIPQGVVERLCAFLMRTQDPSGGWGYQTTDPGGYTRVPQSGVRHSLCAAGLGSLYICGDLLGLSDKQQAKPQNGLPPALRVIENKADVKRKTKTKAIDEALWKRIAGEGNAWFDKNFRVDTPEWNHYYLYAYERYASYRELSEGRIEREPDWYQRVFEMLERTQRNDGGWAGQDRDTIATSFAILCLCRSSKKAIQKIKDLGEGSLLGGMGLPTNTADLQEKDGKVVESKLTGSVDELLSIIEDPENPQLARLAAGGGITLDGDVTKRAGQIVRLRALVSAGSFESRMIAVKTLSKSRDLDNVPVLLYALTDPDVRIVKQADKGLRFVSRKFDGVGLPEEPQPLHIKDAQKAWKEWFLSVRPDAELLD